MSEMSKAQMPAGGDPDPDPSADIVPPAGGPEIPPPASADDSGAADDSAPADPAADIPRPAPDRGTPVEGGGSAASDPMPDMAGTDPD